MAFGRLERSTGPQPMSDINMTPLIDVMLVLLVIFMITAPLMSNSLRLDLPNAASATPSDAPQFVSVTLMPDGKLFVDSKFISVAAFQVQMKAAAQRDRSTEVRLRADKGVPYGRVAELIGWVQAAGLNRIAFVAEPPTEPKP